MKQVLTGFWDESEGQGLAEYGLILSIIAILAMSLLLILGEDVYDLIDRVVQRWP